MADIVLKDRNGKDVTYKGIETVTFDTSTEGQQATFTEGVALEGMEIAPDFSEGDMPIAAVPGILVKSAIIKKPEGLIPENIRNGFEVAGVVGTDIGDTEEQTVPLAMAGGDMVIEPSEVGKVLSRVTIQKPETLVPENIAEGVDIAGLVGTFVGVSKVQITTGLDESQSSKRTIQHGLGVVPDLIYAFAKTSEWSSTSPCISSVFAVSKNIKELFGLPATEIFSNYGSSGSVSRAACDFTASNGFPVYNVNTESFTVGTSSSYQFYYKTQVYWIAISGLT